MGVGGASAAWEAYEGSASTTKTGKWVNATAAGVLSTTADLVVGNINLAAALYDPVVKYGFAAVGHKEFGDSISIGKWTQGTVNQYMGLGRAVWNHDSAPLNRLHAQNMSGANGRVLQGYAMLGEKIADAMDPVYGKIVDWTASHPNRVVRSVCWWVGH